MALALANYHPQLREAVLADVPETAGDSAFLADGKLDADEIAALDRAQSVFGLDAFYRAWELEELTPNQVHAVLYILTFYDPYATVHDVTADPDDPDAEGAALTRALDDFGVYPGSCLYCKGQKSGQPRDHISDEDGDIGLFRRMILLHLAHHAKVQADALSPCDLRDFTEEELIALGFMEGRAGSSSEYAYIMLPYNFVASVRLTDGLLAAGIDDPVRSFRGGARVLIRPGEVLSPFTHAIRAAGGPPSERGLEPCLEAVKGIVEWDRKRYFHYLDLGWQYLYPLFRDIFPPYTWRPMDHLYIYHQYPTWAWFLVDQSGGQDKGIRLMNQFRALNLPAIRESWGIFFDETAAEASSAQRGVNGVLLSPYRLYLHRNIGFSREDIEADIDDLIRRYSFPERCRVERITPGTVERRERPSRSGTYSHYVWKREHHGTSLLPANSPYSAQPLNVVYACD